MAGTVKSREMLGKTTDESAGMPGVTQKRFEDNSKTQTCISQKVGALKVCCTPSDSSKENGNSNWRAARETDDGAFRDTVVEDADDAVDALADVTDPRPPKGDMLCRT